MPLVSAVLIVNPEHVESFAAIIGRDDRVTVGAPHNNRLPVVLDTATRHEDKLFWLAMKEHPHVLHHHVVFADVSDITNSHPAEVSQ